MCCHIVRNENKNTIEVEYKKNSNRWNKKGEIEVESVEFVSQTFNSHGRWIVLQYNNNQSKYQLVVEDPKSHRGHTFYEIKLEKIEDVRTLVDKSRARNMPTLDKKSEY
jgi:cobyrinic acid a,c-diamide synthase